MDGRQAQPVATSSPGAGGLLARLLDEVVEPVTLPGLVFRPALGGEPPAAGPSGRAEPPLARPGWPAWPDAAPSAGRPDPPGADGADEARRPTPAPPPAQAEPDVDAVAERVYRWLLRQQRLERERRGRY
jgi:hypothetical protein